MAPVHRPLRCHSRRVGVPHGPRQWMPRVRDGMRPRACLEALRHGSLHVRRRRSVAHATERACHVFNIEAITRGWHAKRSCFIRNIARMRPAGSMTRGGHRAVSGVLWVGVAGVVGWPTSAPGSKATTSSLGLRPRMRLCSCTIKVEGGVRPHYTTNTTSAASHATISRHHPTTLQMHMVLRIAEVAETETQRRRGIIIVAIGRDAAWNGHSRGRARRGA